MRVAEGDVSDWDLGAYGRFFGRGIGDGDALVGQSGTSDAAEEVEPEVQEFADAEEPDSVLRGQEFAGLGALPIAEVDRVGVEVAGGERGADHGVHASGEAD